MRDLRESLLAKIIAIFLAGLLFLSTGLSLAGLLVFYEGGLGRTLDFSKSEVCADMTASAIYAAYSQYQGESYRLYSLFGVNFGYEIYGPPAAGNPEEGAPPVDGETESEPALSGTPETAPDTADTPEVPEEEWVLLASSNVPKRSLYTTTIPIEGLRITGYVHDPILTGDSFYYIHWLNQVLYQSRSFLLPLCALSLLLLLVVLVFLCCAVGHRAGAEGIVPNHQDRIPLDLYLCVMGTAICLGAIFSAEMIIESLHGFRSAALAFPAGCGLAVLVFLLCLAVLLTLATRFKLGLWWRNTVVYRVFLYTIRLLRRMGRMVRRTIRLLPYAWRTVLAVGGILFLQFFLITVMWNTWSNQGFWFLCLFCMDGALLMGTVFYVWQIRRLLQGGEDLAAGNLDSTIDTERMFWDFKRHADNLNAIGEGMNRAVEQRLRSERLKTELITNVSHDIKTPLTSIVNYVDLLKKEALAEPAAGYVEVLDRQSRRLKKLTEDLVEASKASTGNVAVNLQPTVVNEVIHQAVGEYAERLTAGKLEVVVNTLQGNVMAMADGRLLWRVLDNLLSNVSKYAQPGTRVYIDLKEEGERIGLAVKNISRDPLNIDASELTERFVRGDQSRNTEGSGLGLNIAKSLVELMRGEFRLNVDGDLFKAEIFLPRTEKAPA